MLCVVESFRFLGSGFVVGSNILPNGIPFYWLYIIKSCLNLLYVGEEECLLIHALCSVKLGNAVETLDLEVIQGRSPGPYYSSSQQILSSFWFLFSKNTNVVGNRFLAMSFSLFGFINGRV